MEKERCEKLEAMLSLFDDIDRKFILWYLLGKYTSECMDYANTHDDRGGECAKLTADKARDIEHLLSYDLW